MCTEYLFDEQWFHTETVPYAPTWEETRSKLCKLEFGDTLKLFQVFIYFHHLFIHSFMFVIRLFILHFNNQ